MWCISQGVFFLSPFRFQFNYSRKRHFVGFIILLISGHPQCVVICEFNSRFLLNRLCFFISALIVEHTICSAHALRGNCVQIFGVKKMDLTVFYRQIFWPYLWSIRYIASVYQPAGPELEYWRTLIQRVFICHFQSEHMLKIHIFKYF